MLIEAGKLGNIPREAPRLHTTDKRIGSIATRSKLLGRNETHFADSADRHDWDIRREVYGSERVRVVCFQGRIDIPMDAARYRPLCSVGSSADIQYLYRLVLLQPLPECWYINHVMCHCVAPLVFLARSTPAT